MLGRLFFLILILVTVGLNTLAQMLLKLGSGQNPLNLFILSGLVAYGLSTVFYILVLGKLNLSVAYPVVIGLTVVATTLTGAVLLREKVSSIHWLGLGLMLSGISAIAFAKA
ncbi:SMR family transporter [Leptothermofonsia sp. ETS-13]|uniref:SMR family transporter n=1 Tax=Leptothermofonsia sp. ETS-13 TaxID=3035696 RepID=UPI003BA09566